MESARPIGEATPRRENGSSSKRDNSITAVIYTRISLDKTGEALGVERQEAACRSLCESRGYNVTRVISENSVSATKGVRPGFGELLQLVKQRRVDVVVAYKVDRLLRKLTDLEDLIKLTEDTGVQIVTAHGDIDLSSSSGRLVGRLLATVARAEVEALSERRIIANAQKAAQGRPYGGRRMYGFEPDGKTVRESEAAVINEMARRVLLGHSYGDVAQWANEAGHGTTGGIEWRSVTVRNALIKPKYAGIRRYNGVDYDATWEPILDRTTWDRLQLTVNLRAQKTFIPRPRTYLLTGLLYCGRCGQKMIGSTTHDSAGKRRCYVCTTNGSKHLSRSAEALEHYLTELVFYRMETPELGQLMTGTSPQDDRLKELLADKQLVQERSDGLADDYGSGLLDARQFERAKLKAKQTLDYLSDEIDRLAHERSGFSALPLGEAIRDAWERNTSVRWRQTVLAVLIKKVTVQPGTSMPYYKAKGRTFRFDPALIEIEWKV